MPPELAQQLHELARHYLPALTLLVLAVGFAGLTVALSRFVGPQRPTREKNMPYECGVEPVGSAKERFSIKFYLVAMLFIIFDIEAVFLYPWAVAFGQLGMFGLLEMLVFIALLLAGYVYIWKRGALEWE
ncbi:MAG TPA: NADH-quinone oxidoreductase subunit A [Candidatus Saccharimonadales bacterium]|nr:NADH-quinone oxidoreductase subunit A [Candidatus Saccharimonadales bacterium]